LIIFWSSYWSIKFNINHWYLFTRFFIHSEYWRILIARQFSFCRQCFFFTDNISVFAILHIQYREKERACDRGGERLKLSVNWYFLRRNFVIDRTSYKNTHPCICDNVSDNNNRNVKRFSLCFTLISLRRCLLCVYSSANNYCWMKFYLIKYYS